MDIRQQYHVADDTGFSVWNDDALSSEGRVVADFIARIDGDHIAIISGQVLYDGRCRFTGYQQLSPVTRWVVYVVLVVVVGQQLAIANSHRPLGTVPPSSVHGLYVSTQTKFTSRLTPETNW